ncbi:hypothetical protein HPT27_05345 [Permianibacter sp. IMCC34836]|uniref:hypothetical protein n=1 Tax=Permianibacter fluminis TaxID=2738515 RepID=UPI001556373D|nr:hypothetical protein [Permianibacter fluminis]NQD36443.1 hypothetical protein [Permianibacter fluminis]
MARFEDGNSWWLLPLGDAIQASPVLQTVQELFAERWPLAGHDAAQSLWLHTDSDGLHCLQTLYFSPGCRALAEQFHAVACPPPNRAVLQHLAGGM